MVVVDRHIASGGLRLARRVDEVGFPDDLLARAAPPDVTDRYAAYTRQPPGAGVFGAPSYAVDGEIFWGKDRLDLVARQLHAG